MVWFCRWLYQQTNVQFASYFPYLLEINIEWRKDYIMRSEWLPSYAVEVIKRYVISSRGRQLERCIKCTINYEVENIGKEWDHYRLLSRQIGNRAGLKSLRATRIVIGYEFATCKKHKFSCDWKIYCWPLSCTY